ncbi:MAG: hypothetical protein IKK21_08950 [Clostridia bacterium]|nr:hypothetical protein [Clostridia bacterium]
MRMMKRLAAALLALMMMMMMIGGAGAETAGEFPHEKLVELTVAAMFATGEAPLRFGPDTMLPASFVEQFFLLGRQNPAFGITDSMLASGDLQMQYLEKNIACGGAETEAISADAQPGERVSVAFSELEMLWGQYNFNEDKAVLCRGSVLQGGEFMGYEVIAVLRGTADTAIGWKLESCLIADVGDTDFVEQHMLEYVNSELGFSMLYPAVFQPDMLEVSGADVSMMLPDNAAALRISRAPNTDGWTVTSYAEALQSGETAFGSSDFAVWELGHFEDGSSYLQIRSFTPEWDYTLIMTYDLAHTPEFTLYQDYVINSFSVEGNGVG